MQMIRRGVAYLVLLASIGACTFGSKRPPSRGDGGTLPDSTIPGSPSREEVIRALANDVILPSYRTLETAALSLEQAATALEAMPSDAALKTALQDEWRSFMVVWQRAQVYQVGPLGSGMEDGLKIRDEIDGWPTSVSTCGINTRTANGTFVDTSKADISYLGTPEYWPVTQRGVATMEYLLFAATASHTCTTDIAGWAAITDLDARRATYMVSVAKMIRERATQLRSSWEADSGNFVANFGGGGTRYTSVNQALNAISDALFYIYFSTRDLKVAYPAGIDPLCATVCPEAVESRYAGASLAHIRANLLGFRAAIVGGEIGGEAGLGFDDLLIGIGQDALATTLIGYIDAAIALVEAQTLPLETIVVNDPTTAMAIFNALREISMILKTQFTAVLGLSVPAAAAGDND